MADNTNAQAVKVANDKLRPAADRLLQTYFLMKSLQAEFTAQGWASLFPSGDPTGELLDGARQDGRTIVQNQDVNAVITALSGFITFMEATSNLQLNRFLKIAVNPERV